MSKRLVDLENNVKVFPGVRANDGVDFDVLAGEVHGLLGENGAGKSTLMSILYGLYQPDEGTIRVDGVTTKIRSPRHALDLGIAIVQQHFSLVPTLTVTENVLLGQEGGRIRRPKTDQAQVAALCERYQLDLDPSQLVSELSIGAQQRVEILKCLYREPKVQILDEPTTVLTPLEIDGLFETVRLLAAEGRGIVIITHKLDELMAITDRVTVLRAGRNVETVTTAGVDTQRLARVMVGREVKLRAAIGLDVDLDEVDESGAATTTDSGAARFEAAPALRLRDIQHRDAAGVSRLIDIDLDIAPGEILGVAGVEGNGQRELVGLLCGTLQADAGTLELADGDLTNAGPRALQEAGVRVVTEDRQSTGAVLDMTVAENLVTDRIHESPFSRRGIIDLGEVDRQATELIREFRVLTPGPHTPLRTLSGGNQQRAILARELSRPVTVLVAAQPTRGLDVGAIEEITERIQQAKAAGAAVLLVSSDLTEVMSLADRIVVMHAGRISEAMPRREASLARLGPMMAGIEPAETNTEASA